MADVQRMITTAKGHAFMMKSLMGSSKGFIKIRLSATDYKEDEIYGLTELSGIVQETLVSRVTKLSDVSLLIEGAVTNTEVTQGYFLRSIGLYADDPDEGEILYAVARAEAADYIPPYNGRTVTGVYLRLMPTVSNASEISLQVDPGAVATIRDLEELRKLIEGMSFSGPMIYVAEMEPPWQNGDWWHQVLNEGGEG